jgi:hypothetical protein
LGLKALDQKSFKIVFLQEKKWYDEPPKGFEPLTC